MHDRNALKAGTFIIASIVLMLAVIVGIRGIGTVLEPRQMRSARFALTDDLGGLRAGDDVRVGGLKVGVVKRIEIVEKPGEPAWLMVSFDMPRRLALRQGTRIRVQSPLTGASCLNIDDLGGGADLDPAISLKGLPSAYSETMASLSATGPEIAALVRDLRTLTVPRVHNALETMQATGMRAGEAMAEVRDLVGDSKTDLRSTIANLNAASSAVREKLPAMLDRLDSVLVKVGHDLDSAAIVLDDVRKTASNLTETSSAAKSIVISNRGRIESFIASVKAAGDNLKFASAEIRRSPWRLLYKPGKDEVANLSLYDSARQFAEGAGNINDAATALRDALRDPSADPAALRKLLEKLNASMSDFRKVEQDLWKQVRAD